MKTILWLEYLGGLLLSLFLFSLLPLPWWIYAVFFLAPDMSMIGYLINPRVGAATYNVFHHLGVAVVVYIAGSILGVVWLQAAGVILVGHLYFDRLFGYGLKYDDKFKHTHLGTMK